MLEQIKQRIRIFCLTCGKACAALIWLLCLTAMMFYIYTIYRDPESLTFVIMYLLMSVFGIGCFGYLVYDWYRRGRDKRSNSGLEVSDLLPV